MGGPSAPGPGPAHAVSVREVERKLAVPEGFTIPEIPGRVPGIVALAPMAPAVLVAAYHDTPDLRLARSSVSLRRREGGTDAGWHLKLPAPGREHGRDERRLPLGQGEIGRVPEALATVVLPLVREAPLGHRGTVRTERTGWELVDADGEVIAELVDDRVRTQPSGRGFRQIEVEARVADARSIEVLDAVVGLLVGSGAAVTTETKAEAALGVVEADASVPFAPVPRRHDPAGMLVRYVLAGGVRELLLADVDVRRDAPDAVHHLRVAARTLRSVLTVFGPLVDREWATALRDGLRETAATWGEARDLEVQLGLLLAGAATLPAPLADHARRAVGESLRARERVALDRAASVLSSPQHVDLLVALVDAAVAPRLSERANAPIADVVPDLLAPTFRRVRHATRALQLDGRPSDWHRARVLAKRARYAAEMVAPVLPGARRPATRLARLTDLLGRVQDGVVGRSLLAEIAEQSTGPTAFALQVQAGRQEEEGIDARRDVLDAWPQIAPYLRRTLLAR